MGAGITVLFVSVFVALVMLFASREHHVRVAGVDVFRYPTLLIRSIALGTPAYGVMAAIVFSTYKQPMSASEALAFIMVFSVLIVGNTIGFFYLRSVFFEVRSDGVVMGRLGSRIVLSYDAVSAVCVMQGRRGGAEIRLIDTRGKCAIAIPSSIQDFGDLVWQIESVANERGIDVQQRDSG